MKMMKVAVILLLFLSPGAFAQQQPNTLTLDQAVAAAVESNPDLMASDANVDVLNAKLMNTRSVLFPQVEFRFIIPFVERESGLFVDQLIWDFWRTPSLIKSGKAQVESSKFDREATKENVILNTKVAYYTALGQQHVLRGAEMRVTEQQKRLEQAEGFYKAGRSSKLEITKAKVNLGNSELNVIKARNDLEISKAKLATLMGMQGDLKYELVDVLEYKKYIDVDLQRSIDRALQMRPEMRGLKEKEKGLQADLSASKNNLYFPQVVGRAAWRFEGEGATGKDFIAGLGIRFPIFTGFSHLAGVHESYAKLKKLEAEADSTRGQIIYEVKQLYLNLKSTQEALRVMEASTISAQENLGLAQERYRLGRGSQVELAEAEALFAETNANRNQAIYNYKIAIAQLERATGEKIE